MSIRLISAAAVVMSVVLLNGCNNDSGTSSGPGGQDPNGFTALLGATFAHPRCQNCHGFDEGNQLTVIHENRPTNCSECHRPPGWRAAFKSFSFTGQNSNEICVGIKNKFGGDAGAVGAHMQSSLLIQWGLEPIPPMLTPPAGGAPPGNIAAFNALVDQWVANGASCN